MVNRPVRLKSPLRFIGWPLTMLVVTVGACAHYRDGTREVSDYVEHSTSSRPETGEQYARTPPPPTTEAAPEDAGTGMRTLDRLRDFIVLALERNPDIHAAEKTARAKSERIRQVTALPDPWVNGKVLPEPVRTAEGDNFFILGISQKFPVPEKLDRAGRVAIEKTRMALQQLQATRLRVIADVKRGYFQLYVIDRSVEVTNANQKLLRGLIDVARAQVAVGRRNQEDVLRAQVEFSNLEAELVTLRQRRVTVAARLNELLDREPLTAVQTPGEFGIRDLEFSVEQLLASAARANPELKRLKRQIERDRESLELAKLAYWPDFSLGFEWMYMEPRDAFRPPPNPNTGRRPVVSTLSEDGSDNWAITFGFSLPIWLDKNEGGIAEARGNLAASQEQYRAATNRVEFTIADALERVRAQQQLARLFKNTIIPQVEQTYHVSQASYAAGTSDFLYVIDNWRKWLVFSIQYYRSLGELERSVADLEQAIGLSLSEAGES